MISNVLQKRIHFGDREAFLAIYQEYGPGVYSAARRALRTDALAQNVVKQTFLTLYEDILTEMEDFDIPVRIRSLADHEILLMRLVSGETSADETAEALRSKATISPEQYSARSAFFSDEGFPMELPLLERRQSYRRPKRALFARNRKKGAAPASPAGVFIKILVLLLDLILLWALVGVLMSLGYLPALDLGYSWFTHVVYPLFSPRA